MTAASAAWLASYGARVAPAGGSTTCETTTNARDGFFSFSRVLFFSLARSRSNARERRASFSISRFVTFSSGVASFANASSIDASSRIAWTMAGRNCLATFPTPFTSFIRRLQSAARVRHAAKRSKQPFAPSRAPSPLGDSPYALSHREGMHPTFAMTTSGVPCVNRTRSRHRATSASSPRSTRETSHCSASHSGQCWLRSDATRSALGVAAATVRRQSGYARSDASKARPMPWPASARTTVLAQSLTRPPALASEEANARVAVASGAKPSPQGTNVDARREKRGRARTSAGARAARRSTAGRDMVRCGAGVGRRKGRRERSVVARTDVHTFVK